MSKACTDKAHEAVQKARQALDANNRHGQSVVRRRERAARKADVSVARHSKARLEHETSKLIRERAAPLRQSGRRRL